jgi:hypothetical protein
VPPDAAAARTTSTTAEARGPVLAMTTTAEAAALAMTMTGEAVRAMTTTTAEAAVPAMTTTATTTAMIGFAALRIVTGRTRTTLTIVENAAHAAPPDK